MQRNLHFLADLWNLAHLLPSIKLMIIARKKNHRQEYHTINRIRRTWSDSADARTCGGDVYKRQMQRNLHCLADLWNLAHLLPSIKLMMIARKKNHRQEYHTINRIRRTWSDSADARTCGGDVYKRQMQRNLHFLADLWNLAHLLPSIKLMIIARKKNHIQEYHTINRESVRSK
ncbi:hypothetical protein DEO72_LG7g2035 [Vigna unguiculata]|uniref:Uncharacterized protein n=1 Tax=Vigna unguiculata TaxID=3917 RepID=A0A4D6MLV3_VIGUN|nr:hypothetical protein DEO72_LG7g2035 [Vigna unguiculata]